MAYHGPLPPAPRRSLSLPGRPAAQDPSQIEILYTLPSVRIISFTTATSASSPGSNSASPSPQEEVGTLSWTSRFERTLAVGPLRIYRAPGSVAFLSCRETLRPILPKSQAWCVDDESSKFVLQIKRPQYWRIEIPHESSDDKLRSEQLKEILGKVLMFEKTACPFQRSFTVELPKAPETPVKKRPWKPVDRKSESPLGQRLDVSGKGLGTPEANSSAKRSPPTSRSVSPLSSNHKTTPETPRKPSVIDSSTQTPPISHIKLQPLREEPVHARQPSPSPGPRSAGQALSLLQSATSALEDSDSYSDYTDDTNVTPRNRLQARLQHFDFEPETPKAPDSLKTSTRSNAVPPLRSLTNPPSKHESESPLRRQSSIESDSSETSLSGASFYSTQSWHTPLAPPSPPVSPTNADNIVLPKRQSHLRDTSEITVTLETPRVRERSNSFPTTETEISDASLSNPPTLISDKGDRSDEERSKVVTPPVIRPVLRHRATTSSNSGRRTLSPLPPAVNLFSPPRRHSARHLQTARHLPTAIIQKTCEILLSPPGHLLNLMINIASKIAAGEWRGALSGHGEAVHWDFTEDEYSSGDAWNEDDFGISLSGKPNVKDSNPGTSNTTMEYGGSWEVD